MIHLSENITHDILCVLMSCKDLIDKKNGSLVTSLQMDKEYHMNRNMILRLIKELNDRLRDTE